jgi:hypothetical protein
MNITWINEASTNRYNGAFMTMRSHRERDGTVRLNLYFSAYAAKTLGLHRGERLLVGLDDAGHRLFFKPTLFGGNSIKGREMDESLQCMLTLPVQNLPKPQHVHESEVIITKDHMAVPFEFDIESFAGWNSPQKLKVAA